MAEGTLVITISNQVAAPPIVSPAPALEFITGWHVPSSTEWETLRTYLIANGFNYDGTIVGNKIGKSLASKAGWTLCIFVGKIGNNPGSNNSSGFNALATGWRDEFGSGQVRGNDTIFWSANAYNSFFAYHNILQADQSSFIAGTDDAKSKKRGYCIRCIKDGVNPANPGTVTDYDGNVYPTVKIGTQVLMAQNLAAAHYADGTPIPIVTGNAAWAALTTAGMCYYNNIP